MNQFFLNMRTQHIFLLIFQPLPLKIIYFVMLIYLMWKCVSLVSTTYHLARDILPNMLKVSAELLFNNVVCLRITRRQHIATPYIITLNYRKCCVSRRVSSCPGTNNQSRFMLRTDVQRCRTCYVACVAR